MSATKVSIASVFLESQQKNQNEQKGVKRKVDLKEDLTEDNRNGNGIDNINPFKKFAQSNLFINNATSSIDTALPNYLFNNQSQRNIGLPQVPIVCNQELSSIKFTESITQDKTNKEDKDKGITADDILAYFKRNGTITNNSVEDSTDHQSSVAHGKVENEQIEDKLFTNIMEELKSSKNTIEKEPFINLLRLSNEELKEAYFKQKILSIFRVLVYRNFDYSKDHHNINDGSIYYKQIPKVLIYINNIEVAENTLEYFEMIDRFTEINNGDTSIAHKVVMEHLEKENKVLKEININFGYPFFITVKVNNKNKFEYYRKEPYSNLGFYESIDKIINNFANTSLNSIDLVMASNIIRFLGEGKFQDGNHFLTILLHTINVNKKNIDKALYYNKIINFNGFYELHKRIKSDFEKIPIRK